MRITIYVDRKVALLGGNERWGEVTTEVQLIAFSEIERAILSDVPYLASKGYRISEGFMSGSEEEELKSLVGDASVTSIKKALAARLLLTNARASREEAKREKEDREKQEARDLLKDEFELLREEIVSAKEGTLQERTAKEALAEKYKGMVLNKKVVRIKDLDGYFIV